MAERKQPAGPAMTLGNMRALGVQRLIASCLNDACRHQGLIDVSGYPADTEVPYFRSRVKCAKCGGRGNKIDVRPNWKEQTPQASLTGKCGDEPNHFWGCDLRYRFCDSDGDRCAFLMGDVVSAGASI